MRNTINSRTQAHLVPVQKYFIFCAVVKMFRIEQSAAKFLKSIDLIMEKVQRLNVSGVSYTYFKI